MEVDDPGGGIQGAAAEIGISRPEAPRVLKLKPNVYPLDRGSEHVEPGAKQVHVRGGRTGVEVASVYLTARPNLTAYGHGGRGLCRDGRGKKQGAEDAQNQEG